MPVLRDHCAMVRDRTPGRSPRFLLNSTLNTCDFSDYLKRRLNRDIQTENAMSVPRFPKKIRLVAWLQVYAVGK